MSQVKEIPDERHLLPMAGVTAEAEAVVPNPNRKLETAGQRLGEESGQERARGEPVRASPRATLPKSCSRGGTLPAARREVKGNGTNGGRSGSMRGGCLGGYQPS